MRERFFCIQIDKINSLPSLANRAVHNYRQLPTAAPNADYNLTHLNITLINPGREDYENLWKERQYEINVSGGNCHPRKGAVYAYELFLGYSHDAIEEDKVMEWANANIEWLSDTFGRENILSAILHLDEHTPHIHAQVMPIDDRQHLCARSYTGGRTKLKNLRKSYGEAMAQFGLEPPQEYTKADNKGLKKFYRAVNAIVNEKVPEKIEEESLESYIDRCEEWARNIEFRTLSEVEKVNKNIARLLAKQQEYNIENKDVHHLNNILMIKYCGNKKRVEKTILQLVEFIDNVPIETLEKTMLFLEDRFVKNENILGTDIKNNINKVNYEINTINDDNTNNER